MAKPAKPEPKFFLVDEIFKRGIDYYATTWFADFGTAKIGGRNRLIISRVQSRPRGFASICRRSSWSSSFASQLTVLFLTTSGPE
jgi:hypothetical protein